MNYLKISCGIVGNFTLILTNDKVKASKINAVMKVQTSPDPYPCTIFSPRFIKRSLGFIEKIVDSKSFC
jgi:hypothetical protein